MRHPLQIHADSICQAVACIEVDVARPRPGALALRYLVTGSIDGLGIPPAGTAARADGLWQHTCFEAFAREGPNAPYFELNFAPSTEWAAYRFAGYRSGMEVAEIGPPRIATRRESDCYELRAVLELPGDVGWQLGLSAVIEEADGRKSYWALAHPPGKADFHHPDSFALQLPAANP